MASLRKSKWLTLALPLVVFLSVVVVTALALQNAFESKRFKLQSKATLLEIQRALQDYHVAEEIYPRRSPMTGSEIVQFLIDSGHLEKAPLNPWSQTPYQFEALGQSDGITYRTDDLAETYALESTDLALTPDSPLWQLDSTEHHSLE